MTDIVEQLNNSLSAGYDNLNSGHSEHRKEAAEEIMRLRAKIDAMEQQEPAAWAATDETCRVVEARVMGAQPAPNAVAYLDLGVGGYMDIGTDLTDEALATIPKGRHMLGIVGTYGIEGYVPAQPAPEVLSDLTSLLREATDILKWYGNGLHIKKLSGRIDWDAERAKLSRENFEYSFEAYDGTEYYVEDGSRACQLVDKLENALDLACNINNAQPAPSVPDGWKEAAIAWEVCGSLHREYAKGKDPFFKKRQEDFVKHANDARAMIAAAPEAKP